MFVEYDDPGLVTEEVAEDLLINRDVLDDRLDDLYERSLLDSKDELRGTEWFIEPSVEEDLLSSESEIQTTVEAQTESAANSETSPRRTDARAPDARLPEDEPIGDMEEPTTDLIEAIDLPGTPDEQRERREALWAAYRYLRDGINASRDDFETEVFPNNSAGYENPDDGWWQQIVQPGLVALPDVERRGGEWRHVGDENTDRVQ